MASNAPQPFNLSQFFVQVTVPQTASAAGVSTSAVLLGSIAAIATALLRKGNPYLFLEFGCALAITSWFILGVLTSWILRRPTSTHTILTIPPNQRSIVYAVGTTLAATFLLELVRHFAVADAINRFGMRCQLLLYSNISLAASGLVVPNALKLALSAFGTAKALSYLILSSWPILRGTTNPPTLDETILMIVIMLVVPAIIRTILLATQARNISHTDLLRGGTPPFIASISSFMATLLSLTFAFGWYARGALSWGIRRYLVTYLAAVALSFGSIVLLRRFTLMERRVLKTPFEVFSFHISPSSKALVLAVIVLMYSILMGAELKLVFLMLRVLVPVQWSALVCVILVGSVVFYISVSGFWGSLRTDALNVAFFLLLVVVLGFVSVLLVPYSAVESAVHQLLNYAPDSMADLSATFVIMHLIAGVFTTSASLIAAPDTWSRFVLVVPSTRSLYSTMGIAVIGSLLLSGILGCLLIAGTSGHSMAGDWRLFDQTMMFSELAEKRPVDFDGTVSSDALTVAWLSAAISIVLFAFVTTFDTGMSSMAQALHFMTLRQNLWSVRRCAGVSAATALLIAVISFRLPFNTFMTFLPAAAVASAPWWIVHMISGERTDHYISRALIHGSYGACIVVLTSFAICCTIPSLLPNEFLETDIPAFGPVYVMIAFALVSTLSLLYHFCIRNYVTNLAVAYTQRTKGRNDDQSKSQ